ncbi:MAG: hypothetical protein KatS3mg061_3598 [Dehalococcoidia bacterium]|nr:MAG: hypothetical protein KatS3mg061_3598 [Dehalococcoidia bacterium]
MDDLKLVARALAVLRQTPAVWALAVLAALVDPLFTLGGGWSPAGPPLASPRLVDGAVWQGVLVGLPLLVLGGLYLVASFFLAPLVRGGLLWAASQGSVGASPKVEEAFRVGGRHYGRLLLLQALTLVTPLLVIFGGVPLVGTVAALRALFATGGSGQLPALWPLPIVPVLIGVGLMMLLGVVLLWVVGSVVVQVLVLLASLAVVLEEETAGAALAGAWRLVTTVPGPIALVVLGLAALGGVLGTLAFAFASSFFLLPASVAAGGLPPLGVLAAALLVGGAFGLLAQTPVQALRAALFTLLFQQWQGGGASRAAVQAGAGVTSR